MTRKVNFQIYSSMRLGSALISILCVALGSYVSGRCSVSTFGFGVNLARKEIRLYTCVHWHKWHTNALVTQDICSDQSYGVQGSLQIDIPIS